MNKFSRNIIGFISRFKYHITIALGVLIVVFVDENSIIRLISYQYQIKDLKEEVRSYNQQYKNDTWQLRAMKRDPKAIARIARERYFMKADNEDIFVLSDEEQPTNHNAQK